MAARLKACARASASFFAQSGRILSVEMTSGAFTDSEVVLRLVPPGESSPCELRDEVDDIAEVAFPSECPGGWAYVDPYQGLSKNNNKDSPKYCVAQRTKESFITSAQPRLLSKPIPPSSPSSLPPLPSPKNPSSHVKV